VNVTSELINPELENARLEYNQKTGDSVEFPPIWRLINDRIIRDGTANRVHLTCQCLPSGEKKTRH